MILNPFYWIRFFLYLIFRIKSVAVLKSNRSEVGWYYVFNNGMYSYIMSLEKSETCRLNSDKTLTNMSQNLPSCHFREWKPLFTFWDKKPIPPADKEKIMGEDGW